jgi:uncharacterized protein
MIEPERFSRTSLFHRTFYGHTELRAGWRLLMFLCITIPAIRAGNLLVGRLLPERAAAEAASGSDDTALYLIRLVVQLLVILLASWIMARIEGRTVANYGLPWREMFQVRFWQGVLLGFASITGLLVAMRVVGVFHFGSIALHGFDIVKWGLAWTLVFTLVAAYEEFRARGYGLFTLSSGIGFWPAAILSAVYFGYSHHGNSGEDLIGLFNAGAFGLLACFLLRRTGTLWLPVGFHMAFDWGETFFYGVANSGQVLPGHLLNASSSGPAWLSGGSVGPEGSLLATVLLVIVWLICARWLRKVNYPKAASAHS